jgi:hypothetical protein
MCDEKKEKKDEDEQFHRESGDLRQSHRKRRNTSPAITTQIDSLPEIFFDTDILLSKEGTNESISSKSNIAITETTSSSSISSSSTFIKLIGLVAPLLRICPLGVLPLSADVAGLTCFEYDSQSDTQTDVRNKQSVQGNKLHHHSLDYSLYHDLCESSKTSHLIGAVFDCDGTMSLLSNKKIRDDDDYTSDSLKTTNVNWDNIKQEKGIFSSITSSLKSQRRLFNGELRSTL